MLGERNSEAREIAHDLAILAYHLASERMNLLFRRYGVDTKKYNPAQPRVPAKQHGAGQWTKGPSGGAATAARVGARALSTIATNPEAAAAGGTALLPGLIGGIGVSRAAGLNAVVDGGGASQGMGMTPILGLPFKMGEPPSNDQQTEKGKIQEECEEQYDKDKIACQTYAAMYGNPMTYKSKQIFAVCMAQAAKRYAECPLVGGPNNINIPLFDGRKIK